MSAARDLLASSTRGLPDRWYWTTLGELSEKPQYGWTTKANTERGSVKLLRTTDITSGSLDWSSVPYCEEEPKEIETYLLAPGDIVISRAGSVGFSYLLDRVELAVFASYLIRFRLKPGVNKKYVYYYLKSPRYWDAIGASQLGIAIPNVNATKLASVPIPVAPIDQQEHIIAEIEKQSSRLDEAVACLKRVKANLKRYKAAVLKAAGTGKLGDTDRGAWTRTTLGAVAIRIRNGYSGKPNADAGTRIFRISAVRPLKLDLDEVRYLDGSVEEYREFQVTPGDVLFTRYNGSRDLVGVCAVVPERCPPTIHPDKLICVRVPETSLMPAMLAILVSAGGSRAFLETRIRTTAGQSGISGADLKSMPICVPPLPDQHRIVAEVEHRLSMADGSEAQVDAGLQCADRMRQAILKHAFEGRLG